MARSCKQGDGREVGPFGKHKCFNCGRTFGSKSSWWSHLWSIFG